MDVNQDGQITDLDEVPLGHPNVPEIVYGFGFSFGKKGFDLSAFFQGSARSSFWIYADNTSPFYNDQPLLKAYADDHWDENNRNIYALWPRLSLDKSENNTKTNSWFMRNGAFLRLKSVEIGYTFRNGIKKAGFDSLRLYLRHEPAYDKRIRPLGHRDGRQRTRLSHSAHLQYRRAA